MFTLIAEKYGNQKYWILAVIFGGMSFLSKGIGVISFGFIGIVMLYKLFKNEYAKKDFLKLVFIM
jgi:4-amino-4-deoxy-L-arabinose transferase-like glycosyltransferase